MAQLISDQRDIDFVVHEVLQAQTLAELNDNYADFNKKTIDMVIKEAKNLAIKELLPISKEGDEIGCTFENGKVTTPPSFKRAFDLFNEGEWLAPTEDPEWGGQPYNPFKPFYLDNGGSVDAFIFVNRRIQKGIKHMGAIIDQIYIGNRPGGQTVHICFIHLSVHPNCFGPLFFR